MIRRLTGVRIENFYNSQLKYGLTIGTGALLRITQMLIRQLEPSMIKLLARHWQAFAAGPRGLDDSEFQSRDFRRPARADATHARPETPMVTILTDLADYPPHFWIERQQQYLICGTARRLSRRLRWAMRPSACFALGNDCASEFYRPMELSREAERVRLGLDPTLPTGIVMFGSYGSSQMATIARRIEAAGHEDSAHFCMRSQ